MKRTTIFVDEAVEHDLKAIAGRRRRPVAALVREALAEYVTHEKRANRTSLSFVAAGASGHTDTADRHEEILWQDAAPGTEETGAGNSPRRTPRNKGIRGPRHGSRSR